jgi:alpha-galactosidase
MLRRTQFVLLALLTVHPATTSAATLVKAGDASIAQDAPAGTWSISAGGATLTLTLDPGRDFQIVSLVGVSKKPWVAEAKPDTLITIDGTALPFGSRAAGFVYQNVTTSTQPNQILTLDATFDLPKAGLRITRHYRVVSGSPTFEAWNTYTPTGNEPVNLSDLSGFEFVAPNGTLHSVTGLGGSPDDAAFTLRNKQLAVHEEFTRGARGRSSESVVPWVAVDGADDELYVALMWSGAWMFTGYRPGNNVSLSMRLAPMTTTIRQATDGPHVVFGIARGGLPQATAALGSYVIDAIRRGRPLTPLVTYNTWFAYGTYFDHHDMEQEMDRAANLGAELFVIDAGWYVNAGVNGRWDFDSGLGSWQADPVRFPEGLIALREYAHSIGLKFGIWVEPERINLALLGDRTSIAETWLATTNGQYGTESTALICLANANARKWVLDQLTRFIDDVRPDYLKWDNNIWVNCNRPGHEHRDTDGNFSHVAGLYGMLAQLRERYPDLLIENVSGGGNRLDLGMLQYTDVAWMDDRTAPSALVRHNVQGLSAVFPPPYLLSFVLPHADEPLHGAPDMPLYVRSRMEGTLGFSVKGGDLGEDDVAQISHEIDVYKSMRSTLSVASGALLTAQAEVTDGPAWDVLQETSADGARILLWAFQSNVDVEKTTVKPTALNPATTYEVQSIDIGLLGTALGADLMANGIELIASPNTAAHLLILTIKN